jgi:hypothetical protein
MCFPSPGNENFASTTNITDFLESALDAYPSLDNGKTARLLPGEDKRN